MIDARHWLTPVIGLGAVFVSATACPLIDDPNHCANMESSPCLGDQVCDPCTPSSEDNGCVAGGAAQDRDPNQAGCQLEGDATSTETTTVDPSTTTTEDPTITTTIEPDTTITSGDTSTTTTGMQTDCFTEDGTYDPECNPEEPFCVLGKCERCDDADPQTTCATAQGAPGTVCNGGACVQCNDTNATACVGTTPICDLEDFSCTACTAHDQCPGNAGCHLFQGSCLPSDAVFVVDEADPACSPAGPVYCDISSALTAAGTGSEATIRVAAGIYVNNVVITTDAIVAIVGEGDVSIIGSGGSPGVQVNGSGTGYLAGVSVENNGAAPGVSAAGDLRVDDSTIRDADQGLVSTAGRVHLERVRVLNNALTGVTVGGTQPVTLRNVIIAGNNGTTTPRGFVTTADTPFDILYTTIADNAGANGGAINCTGNAIRTARNSILISRNFSNAINCENLDVTYSVISDVDYEAEPGNMPVIDDSGLFFDAGYEIGMGSVASDVALWLDGDPPTDINGVARPTTNSTPDDAGASVAP